MADLSHIEAALVSAIAQAVYPDGTGHPSVAGVDCRVMRGWPTPQKLDADLKAGKLNVTVFPLDIERRITRHAPDWQALPVAAPTLTLAASGITVTVGGILSSPLNAAVLVNGLAYIYPVQPSDTLTSIATGLATLINPDTPASSNGAAITIPGAYRLEARVGAVGTMIREIRRQRRSFQITCWCPTPDSRDLIASAIDEALAGIDYLSLPDGSAGRLLYEKTRVTDGAEREGLYRRDLIYSVEYGTTQTQRVAQIVAEVLNLTDWFGNPIPPRPYAILLESGGFLLLESGGRLAEEQRIAPAPAPTPAPGLELESGEGLLLENGGRFLQEILITQPGSGLLLQSGGSMLMENGFRFLLDESVLPAMLLESGAHMLRENGNPFLLES